MTLLGHISLSFGALVREICMGQHLVIKGGQLLETIKTLEFYKPGLTPASPCFVYQTISQFLTKLALNVMKQKVKSDLMTYACPTKFKIEYQI